MLILERLFLISCFFPFVSFYPINSDIQPIAGILALILIIKKTYLNTEFIPNKYFNIIFASTCFLTYNSILTDFNPDVGKMISLLYGCLILVGFHFSKNLLSKNFINFVVSFYFLWTILLIVFPNQMITIQNLLIRDTNSIDFTYRGVASLVTEPGLFGGLLVFFLIIVDYLKENNKICFTNYFSLYLMIIFMLLATKSGTGYLYFLIFIFFKLIVSNVSLIKKLLVLGGSFLILVLSISYLASVDSTNFGRGAYIFSNLFNISKLLNTDTSIFIRVIDVYLSIDSLLNFPFGVGNGFVNEAFISLVKNNDLAYQFYTVNNKNIGVNSSFTYLTVSYGIFFWLFLFYVFFVVSKGNIMHKFFAFLFLAFSYSSAFPGIWILLGLLTKKIKF